MKLHYFTSGPRERVFDAIVAAGHEVAGIYVTDPARWPKVVPTIERAKARDIPARVVSRRELPALGKELAGETCLSVGFGLLFPASFLASIGACLNVHGTLLPDYPGAHSLNWVIENGEKASGVTVHLVDEGIDTGPILLQKSFPVTSFDTGKSLVRKTLEFEPAVVIEALAQFDRHGAAMARAQDLSRGKRYPDRRPKHSRIYPDRPLTDLYNTIRAADPNDYPAYFFVEGQKVCIRMWRADKPVGEEDMI
jgi:methionyl-tRNA formyltransferase